MSNIKIHAVQPVSPKEFKVLTCRIHDKSEEWSRIIQRLSSVGLWPEGEDGITLALNLVGITVEEVNDETTD